MTLCLITRRRLLTCEGPPRASPRAGHLGPVPPGVFDRGAHVPGALDEASTPGYASCARDSSGVFARTEQHVGQLLDEAAFSGAPWSTMLGL